MEDLDCLNEKLFDLLKQQDATNAEIKIINKKIEDMKSVRRDKVKEFVFENRQVLSNYWKIFHDTDKCSFLDDIEDEWEIEKIPDISYFMDIDDY